MDKEFSCFKRKNMVDSTYFHQPQLPVFQSPFFKYMYSLLGTKPRMCNNFIISSTENTPVFIRASYHKGFQRSETGRCQVEYQINNFRKKLRKIWQKAKISPMCYLMATLIYQLQSLQQKSVHGSNRSDSLGSQYTF